MITAFSAYFLSMYLLLHREALYLLHLQHLHCSTSFPLPLFLLCLLPTTLHSNSFTTPLLSLIQGEAARFPMVSEAARRLICDARWRRGGCQVRALEMTRHSPPQFLLRPQKHP